jgi:hypothetical protein
MQDPRQNTLDQHPKETGAKCPLDCRSRIGFLPLQRQKTFRLMAGTASAQGQLAGFRQIEKPQPCASGQASSANQKSKLRRLELVGLN